MLSVGVVMMVTPTAELAVQLTYGERPQILLLGGFFLVGLLTVSNSLKRRAMQVPHLSPPAIRPGKAHLSSDAIWTAGRKE